MNRANRGLCVVFALALLSVMTGFAAESTHRLYDGVTAFVHNADGRDFN